VLLVLFAIPFERLLALAVVATFATRIAVPLAGFNVRPEHLVTLVLFIRLLDHGGLRLTGRQSRVLVAFIGFVVLNIGVTIVEAPDAAASVSVIGWLILDVLLFVVVCSLPDYRQALLRTGVASAAMFAVLAVLAWIGAAVAGTSFGVQPDPSYGGYAAYVLSYEANTLSSSLAVWGVVAALIRWPAGRGRVALHLVLTLGILATHTRAALIGYLAALGVIALRRRSLSFPVVIAAVAATAFVVASTTSTLPHVVAPAANKFSQPFNFNSGDGFVRMQTWRAALADMRGPSYVVGLGTNTYGQRHLDPTHPDAPQRAYLGNLPLQAFYDTGFLGVLLLLYVAMSVRLSRSGLAWWSCLLVYLVANVATSVFWFSLTWILLAAGLTTADSANRRLHA
jgi:hypothetical protein